MDSQSVDSQDLDHLGLVAGMCEQIELIKVIDELVGPDEREVSVGQAVQAMVLNGLGFVGRALYLTPEFFRTKPVERLIRPGVEAEQLNTHSLSRALDRLFEVGVTEVFASVASHALHQVGIRPKTVHLDSTSFALQGEYDREPDDEVEAIEVRHGYSRDHRPDLKQVVLSLICTHEGAIPTWLQALSGNSADSGTFPSTIRAYLAASEEKSDDPPPYVVADTALYSSGMLADLGDHVPWITRVPASIGIVKKLYEMSDPETMHSVLDDAYRVLPLCTTYGEVRQRWVVVYSEPIQRRQVKTLRKQVTREYDEAAKALRKLGHREYPSQQAALAAVDTLADQWAFHTAQVDSFKQVPHYTQRGRPATQQPPDYVTWQPIAQPLEDDEVVQARVRRAGKFVLATNDLDDQRLPVDQLITLYKGQNTTVERGFRFLKDPLFFAHSLFLKTPSRIMALLMVMGLCLLIYALPEHQLRHALRDHNQTVPDQLGRPTQSITLRRVFQIFEGIHVVTLHLSGGVQQLITNLHDLHWRILRLLGPPFEKMYLPHV